MPKCQNASIPLVQRVLTSMCLKKYPPASSCRRSDQVVGQATKWSIVPLWYGTVLTRTEPGERTAEHVPV
eukprot:395039-Pelagomonas_calceolata.AAC.2